MARPGLDNLLRVADEIRKWEVHVNELKIRKNDIAKQIDQQPQVQSEIERKTATLDQDVAAEEKRFRDKEASLEQRLKAIRAEHESFLAGVQEQRTELAKLSDAAGKLQASYRRSSKPSGAASKKPRSIYR